MSSLEAGGLDRRNASIACVAFTDLPRLLGLDPKSEPQTPRHPSCPTSPSDPSQQHQNTSSSVITMVADALVYHPTVAHYLKYVATTGTSPVWLLPFYDGDDDYIHQPLTHNTAVKLTSYPQSAETSCSARYNTFRASTHGICCGPTHRRRR